MVKKTLSKSNFAELANVSAAAVTKACKNALQPAMVGKRIDPDHPEAVKYLEKQVLAQTPETVPGLDPLYQVGVEKCRVAGKWSAAFLQRELRVGYGRAAALRELYKTNGLVGSNSEAPPPPSASNTRVASGREAAKETKKSAARARLATTTTEDDVVQGSVIHEVPEDIEAFADMTLRELIRRFGTDVAFVDWLKATKEIEYINEKRLKNAQTQGDLVSRELVKIGIIEPIDAAHIKLLTDGAKTITRRVTAMHSAERDLDDIEKFVKDQITSFIRPVKAKVKRALTNA